MSGIGRNGGRLYAQERDWTRRRAEAVQDRLQAAGLSVGALLLLSWLTCA